ncbi:LuxR C-terminal-related transcriptional regulator [Streptomyces kanasensis]|uniref:LuxR C-terminal-related transcriptional regulator n=1 Tax=Streptomyces kanasensis TaxID=936756 RepID=UPI003700A9A1
MGKTTRGGGAVRCQGAAGSVRCVLGAWQELKGGITARRAAGAAAERYAEELAELQDLGIIVRNPYRPRRWFVHHPQHVLRQRIDAVLEGIGAAVGELHSLPRLLESLPAAGEGSLPGIRTVGKAEASRVILRGEARAKTAIWTAQPHDRPAATMQASAPLDTRNLSRGIALRTIYKESARGQRHLVDWAAAVTEAGGHVRTLSKPFLRMVVIDDSLAVVSNYLRLTPAGEPDGEAAVVITMPEAVAWLRQAYLLQWREAEPWLSGHDRRVRPTDLSPRQLEILRGLTTGTTRAGIARALGLSTRTIGEEMRKLYDLFGVASEFALGRAFERTQSVLPSQDGSHSGA